MAGDTQALIKEGIQVAAMMSNDYRYVPADPSANLKRFAQLHGFTLPYLTGKGQLVGRAYGAV